MNLVMKYSTHLLTIFAICICIWGILNSNELSAIQIVMIGFGIIITLHEWEEMHWPGGFMEMMGDIIGWDISGIRQGAEHFHNKILLNLAIFLNIERHIIISGKVYRFGNIYVLIRNYAVEICVFADVSTAEKNRVLNDSALLNLDATEKNRVDNSSLDNAFIG